MAIFKTAKTVLVVDMEGLQRVRGVRGRPAPRQQLQALRSLSRLAEREKFGITAVLSGDPLEKAPHNQVTEGVRVRYASGEGSLKAELGKALRQAGSGAVLVTADEQMEKKALARGLSVLRLSTFRKLLEEGGEMLASGGGGRGNGEPSGKGGNPQPAQQGQRRSRRKKSRPQQSRSQEKPEQEDRGDRSDRGGEDAISRMIDLVD